MVSLLYPESGVAMHTHRNRDILFLEQSELTFITLIIIILLLFSMYIVTINILCQLIFLSLFTPKTLKEDQETGGPGQLSLKSL